MHFGISVCDQERLEYSFLNCIISLLNSSIIDVDKLDYLIRDSYITGFDTIKIDYVRLLQSIRLREINKEYQIVYTKDAISVIENVVYAHDAERKWIQNHPAVQYESYLLQSAFEELKDKYKDVNLFSYQSLTEAGIKLNKDYKISLLCDADIIFLMKNLDSDNVKEYYRSIERRHPLWKSEAEYKAIFTAYSNQIFEVIENAFENLNKYINKVCRSQVINDEAIDACKKDIDNTYKLITDKNSK